MPINGNFKVLVVHNGWNSLERRWNELGEVQAEVSGPISRSGVPLNLTQGRPKWPKLAQNGQKWQFQGFGGPQRLEQLRTKVEWVEGSPSQSFCTVISVIMQRPPMKSVAYLRKNCSRVLWDFFSVFVLLKSFKFGSLLMSQKILLPDWQKITQICQFCCENFLGVAYLR